MANSRNLQRSTLRKLQQTDNNQLIPLRLEYSEHTKLLSGYINQLVNVDRVYPRHLPTQASFRWSTFDPPITNWPRACINTTCVSSEHEWTDNCWSVRDILLPDNDEILITWDHDNIEGKIHDLVVNDTVGIEAHINGYDLHTITCCAMFGYDLPNDLRNPHSSISDTAWRTKYNWQGKDTKQRVLAKNFNHGSKYSENYGFVHKIDGIEKYGITRQSLIKLAKAYIASKAEPWATKLAIMKQIRRARVARTLYGARRVFFDSSSETGREGFSHQISGTVSDYNNWTLILFQREFGDSYRLLHNCHDGNKIVIKKYNAPKLQELKNIIERPITYNGKSLIMTAGVKVHEAR